MGQEQEMRVRSVEFNSVDPSAFEPPSPIRVLMGEEAQ
jgi:hypothetical protein